MKVQLSGTDAELMSLALLLHGAKQDHIKEGQQCADKGDYESALSCRTLAQRFEGFLKELQDQGIDPEGFIDDVKRSLE